MKFLRSSGHRMHWLEPLLVSLADNSPCLYGVSKERLSGSSSGVAKNFSSGSERFGRPAAKTVQSRGLKAIPEVAYAFEARDDDFYELIQAVAQ